MKEPLKKVEELIHEDNIKRIVVKTVEGKTYLEIFLTFGVINILCTTVVAAIFTSRNGCKF